MQQPMLVHKDVPASDIDLFLGPIEEHETIGELLPHWSLAHVVHHCGWFKSVTEAKKNGWDRPVPPGYTNLRRKKGGKEIFILNVLENDGYDF